MGTKNKRHATPAFTALRRAGVDAVAHTYEHDASSASYGLEAAEALGVAAGRVFKTLIIDLDGELCVAVVPVERSLDLKAAASALGGKKAQLADPTAAQQTTGYVLGGISPFGQRKALRTVVDETVQKWPTVFVSGGRRGVEAEVSPTDLVQLTRALTAPISR